MMAVIKDDDLGCDALRTTEKVEAVMKILTDEVRKMSEELQERDRRVKELEKELQELRGEQQPSGEKNEEKVKYSEELCKLIDDTQEYIEKKGLPYMMIQNPDTGKMLMVYSKKYAKMRGLID